MRIPARIAPLRSRLGKAWQQRAVTLKAASFALIGIINTLIDLSVLLAAYNVFHVPLIPANVLAWMVAVSGSYVMNCFVTFAAESGRVLRWRAYGAFVLSGVVGVIANTTTLVVASYWMPVLAAKIVAIAASFVVNFSLSHFVVFRTPERGARTSAE
jgi:putative flippase GtrA